MRTDHRSGPLEAVSVLELLEEDLNCLSIWALYKGQHMFGYRKDFDTSVSYVFCVIKCSPLAFLTSAGVSSE